MPVRPLVLLLLAACASAPPVDETPSCGDNAPVVGDLELVDRGTAEIGGTSRRVVAIQAPVTDEDGDLHSYAARLWYDTFEDGEVGSAYPEVELTDELSDEVCGVDSATLGLVVPLGDEIPFDTNVEFALVVADADGHESNDGVPVAVSLRTPAE